MFNYIIKRLLLMIPTLIGITIISFIIIKLAPGNPSDLLEQQGGDVQQKTEVSYESVDEFRRKYNLDKPLHIQYLTWLKKIVTFDFGESLVYSGRSVWDLIKESLPITMKLSLSSIFITYLIAIPIGVYSATHESSWQDRITTILLFMLYSLPSFFVAIWLIYLLSEGHSWIWFPAKGLESANLAKDASFLTRQLDFIHHLILPIFCLSYASYAYLSRQMRGGMLEVLRQDYIRTARAKGLDEKKVIFKHAFRNSLIPIITIASVILPALIGGSVIIEKIFNIHGMGWLSFEAILKRDYNIIMAVIYLSSILTLIGILISDILYVIVNPRITFD